MNRKLFNVLVIAIMLVTLVLVTPVSARIPAPDDVQVASATIAKKPPMAIGAWTMAGTHLRAPRVEVVE